jgi:hypothetical protein
MCPAVRPSDQDGCTAELKFNIGPYGKFAQEPAAQLEPNFDGIVIGWSFSKIVSGSRTLPPRWPPQCSCVVIESSFDPGERLQTPGNLWSLCLPLTFTPFNPSFHFFPLNHNLPPFVPVKGLTLILGTSNILIGVTVLVQC